MSQDIIADSLNQIMNAKRAGKQEVVVTRHSKVLIKLLELVKKEGYIDEFKIDGNNLTIKFSKLNYCKAIKPRFNVSLNGIDKKIRRFLPSKDFGILIISTNKGLMTHREAYEQNTGGVLLAYFY